MFCPDGTGDERRSERAVRAGGFRLPVRDVIPEVAFEADTKPGQANPAELRAALSREQRVSAALREVGVAIGTTLELDELLELILDRVTELVEADRATLYLLDEAKNELVSRFVVGQNVRSIRLKVGHGIAGTVAQTGRPFRISDAYADARFERQWDQLTGYRTSTKLATPLKNHLGRTIGVIQVLNKKRGEEFTDEDEALLNALSTQAAVAIDNSRLFLSLIQKNKQLLDIKDQLERKLRDLELLFDLERATAGARSIEELLEVALGRLAAACGARGAAALLAEEDSGDLVEYALDRQSSDGLARRGVKAGEDVLSTAMEQSDPVRLLSVRDSSRGSHTAFGFDVEPVLALDRKSVV